MYYLISWPYQILRPLVKAIEYRDIKSTGTPLLYKFLLPLSPTSCLLSLDSWLPDIFNKLLDIINYLPHIFNWLPDIATFFSSTPRYLKCTEVSMGSWVECAQETSSVPSFLVTIQRLCVWTWFVEDIYK